MKQGIISLVLADTRPLRLIIGMCAVVFAVGLAAANGTSGAYLLLKNYAPLHLWAVGFGVYGCVRLITSIKHLPGYVTHATMFLGLFLWVFTLVSFANNPNRAMAAADWMMFVLVLIEVWISASICVEEKDDRRD
jgi:hypothetical protein